MKNTVLCRRSRTTFRPRLESLETRLTPTTYTVSSLADSGEGSLRAAITSVNADTTADEIDFSVAGVIQLTSGAFPAITNTVKINGASAPNFTNAPRVELNANGFAGLVFNTGSGSSSLAGLSIVNAAGAGVTLGASNITVTGNFIGLALDGSTVAANTGDGLSISAPSPGSAENNTIGGTGALDRNVISGNTGNGISILGVGIDNQVIGNLIGTDATGTSARGNGADGILLSSTGGGVSDNTIGGAAAAARNIISGNGSNGIEINPSRTNTVINNYIGTDVTGAVALANQGFGVVVGGQDQIANVIGGSDAADTNVISGNGAGGIELREGGFLSDYRGNEITGNHIGTDSTGQQALPNQGNGITISSYNNQIGGLTTGAGNTIAFNTQNGIEVNGSNGNAILSNLIFNNAAKGIDLENSGNHNAPAPQLSYAVESPGSIAGSSMVQVGGVLNGLQPGTLYQIQIFASLASTPAGQGQLLLGTVSVTTSSLTGFAAFTLRNTSVPAGSGTTFTATATDQSGDITGETILNDTSMFSTAIGESTANQAYVASVYQLLLSRIPDPSAAVWVNDLNNGSSAASVVLGVQGSSEYLNDQVFVLYYHYLKRNPDVAGEQAWTNFLLAGNTLEQVAEGMVSSDEYFSDHGSVNLGYVAGLYQDVLNRVPSNTESALWLAALNAGGSRQAVAADFLTSQEYRTNLVQADYMTFLLRPADSGGLMAWVNALNAGATDQEVLAGILGSPEGYQLWS